MPCSICNQIFYCKPCESKDRISNREAYETSYFTATMQIHMVPFIKVIYSSLHFNCICIDCLVKGMCNKPDECDKFKMFIDQHDEVFKKCLDKSQGK